MPGDDSAVAVDTGSPAGQEAADGRDPDTEPDADAEAEVDISFGSGSGSGSGSGHDRGVAAQDPPALDAADEDPDATAGDEDGSEAGDGGVAPDPTEESGSGVPDQGTGTGTGTGTAAVDADTADAPADAHTAVDADQPSAVTVAVAVAVRGWRARFPRAVRPVARTTTVLAAALVLLVLLLPRSLPYLKPSTFVRLPVEAILAAALLLVLPPKPRRVVAAVIGAGLGLLTVLKFLDMGFYSTLDRQFDLVLDWILLDDGMSFLEDSLGRTGAISAVIGVVVLVLVLVVLITLSVMRLSHVMARNRAVATRTTFVVMTVWVVCAALGVQITGSPLASRNAVALVEGRVHAVRAGIADEKKFKVEAGIDAFRNTPPDQLLSGLRGKDVIFTFIESYGRVAIDDPSMSSQIGTVLENGTEELHQAGFDARSAWLNSPTFGGGSWLAHSTFLSGLWIKNQQRYRSVTSSDRLTLTDAFRRTDAWRTVGIMPGVTRAWPEGKFYGLDHVYDTDHLGYHGPKFSWSRVPDQYSLAAFERLEHGKNSTHAKAREKGGEDAGKPLMSEIILVSSHNPWAPIPKMLAWNDLGDGSVYDAVEKAGKDPKQVWRDPKQVKNEYRRAIEYSLHSLIDYVKKYGNKNTVLVFLGDHQPVSTVTGDHAGHQVPVTIVAHDPKVLDRIDSWGWQEGLKPAPKSPVWQMSSFRDRFLTAYGPKP